jgi:hypothetical protein
MAILDRDGKVLSRALDLFPGLHCIENEYVVELGDTFVVFVSVEYEQDQSFVSFRGLELSSAYTSETHWITIQTDKNGNYIKHIANTKFVCSLAANDSHVLIAHSENRFLDFVYRFRLYDSRLERVKNRSTDKLTQALGNESIQNIRMNADRIFILSEERFEKTRLRLFDFETFNQLQVIDSVNGRMKLLSTSYLALLSYDNILFVYDQKDGEKKKEIWLKEFDSYSNGMTEDNSRFVTFFDHDRFASLCID